MNDKENNSTPKDKSIADTVEDLFDDFFGPEKPDELHDSKKREPDTPQPEKKVQQNIETDKPLPKKVSPDNTSDIKKKIIPPVVPPVKSVQPKIAPQKQVINKKTISPVQPEINKPAIKPDISSKEKGLPPKDFTIKTGKDISMKPQPKITKLKFGEVFSKYLSLLIFAVLILLIVILSMFIGKIVDYDGMFKSLNTRSPISAPEPVPIIKNIDKEKINISGDDKIDPLKETPLKSDNTQSPGIIKHEQKGADNTLSIVYEKRADTASKDIKVDNLSYPYSIYLGSYNSVASVKELSSNYMKMGITSYWIKLDLGEKGVWYRLYVGCFQKREQADEYIKTWKLPDAESKNTKYANLIETYIAKEDAEKNRAYLEEKGYSAYIISYSKDSFRLYTGAFYKQEQAEAQKIDLESNGIKSLVVER